MPKKRKKLDQFLQSRKQSQEAALEESGRLSNHLIRVSVGVVVVIVLLLLVNPPNYTDMIGLGIVVALGAILGSYSVSRLKPDVFPNAGSFNRFIFLLLVTVVASRALLFVKWSPEEYSPYLYLTPLPILGMLAAMAYSQVVALFLVLGLGLYLGLLNPVGERVIGSPLINFQLAVALCLGAMVSVLGMVSVRKQSRPARVGFYTGVVQALTILSFQMLTDEFSFARLEDPTNLKKLQYPAFGLAGGVLCGAIVTTLLPAIERFLGVITERRLLDLADPSNNLLRVLRERAPGTFSHTLGVQQLARAGAEAIGADSLLADVGAYYHDIGKIYKPEYFVENMGEDKTIHDRLRPSMSKLIIISHVKDGIELAKEEKLPQKIIDMIPMHHGTTVVEFFYRKAQREEAIAETPGNDVEYRYPGPRPRFREAGILMLADAVEAIAKTISEPTSIRFRDMVRGVIHKRLLDQQLNECNLTMADLHKIEDSFVKTLTTIYHGRIRYPKDDEPPEKKTAARDPVPQKVGSK